MKNMVAKLGESLVRARLQKLNERSVVLRDARTEGRVGPRVFRARLRCIKRDLLTLENVARRYGIVP